MQVNIISAVAVQNNTSASKSTDSDSFDEALNDAQRANKDDNSSLAQLAGAYHYAVASQHQQNQQQSASQNTDAKKDAKADADDSVTAAVVAQSADTVQTGTAASLLALLQLSAQGLIRAGTAAKQPTAADATVAAQQTQAVDPTTVQSANTQTVQSAFAQVLPAQQMQTQSAQSTQAAQPLPEQAKQPTELTNAAAKTAPVPSPAGQVQAPAVMLSPLDLTEKEVTVPSAVSVQQAASQANTGTVTVSAGFSAPLGATQLDTAQLPAAQTAAAQKTGTVQTLQATVSTGSKVQVADTALNKPAQKAEAVTEKPAFGSVSDAKQTSGSAQAKSGSSGSQSGGTQTSSKDTGAAQAAFAAMNTMAAKPAESAQQTAKADVANQISQAVREAVDTGRTEIRLHLSPEDLGGISIKITSQSGILSLQITADNHQTGQLLASGMQELAKSMQDQGVTMNRAEVGYTGTGGSLDTSAQQGQQNQQNTDTALPKWTPAMEQAAVKADSGDTVQANTSGSGISILA